MCASERSDHALVRAVAAGDRDALGMLYDQYANLLMTAAMALLGRREDAEDIVHNVFIEVWQRAHTYEPSRGSVRAWLVVRARSRSLDRLKSSAVARRRGYDAQHDQRASAERPDTDAERSMVHRLVGGLPEPQQEIVVLSYFAGLSSSEIADALSIPTGTVKSRMAASLRSLRAALEGLPPTSATPRGA